MLISEIPQLPVKPTPSEHASTSEPSNHSFLQPSLPNQIHNCHKNSSKLPHKDLSMITESSDFSDHTIRAGMESPILEEHEHEIIEWENMKIHKMIKEKYFFAAPTKQIRQHRVSQECMWVMRNMTWMLPQKYNFKVCLNQNV